MENSRQNTRFKWRNAKALEAICESGWITLNTEDLANLPIDPVTELPMLDLDKYNATFIRLKSNEAMDFIVYSSKIRSIVSLSNKGPVDFYYSKEDGYRSNFTFELSDVDVVLVIIGGVCFIGSPSEIMIPEQQ